MDRTPILAAGAIIACWLTACAPADTPATVTSSVTGSPDSATAPSAGTSTAGAPSESTGAPQSSPPRVSDRVPISVIATTSEPPPLIPSTVPIDPAVAGSGVRITTSPPVIPPTTPILPGRSADDGFGIVTEPPTYQELPPPTEAAPRPSANPGK